MSKSIVVAMALLSSALVGRAHAHSRLIVPTPRSTETGLEMSPCSGVAKGTTPTSYQAGSQITITMQVDIPHNATYKFYLLRNNDADATPLTSTSIPEVKGNHDAMVTFPAGVTCTNCTLQMVQDSTTYKEYYSCADITLTSDPVPAQMDASVPSDASVSNSPNDANSTDEPGSDAGSCAVHSVSSRGIWGWCVVFALLILRQRHYYKKCRLAFQIAKRR